MPPLRLPSSSPTSTAALAGLVARVLRAGDVVRLVGPLGAGKTTFVRALGEALGVEAGLVSSPSFVLCNIYPTVRRGNDPPSPQRAASGSERVGREQDQEPLASTRGSLGSEPPHPAPDLVHIDCYRMGGPDEFDTIGWDRLVGSGAFILIEWPERIDSELPADCATIRFEHTGESSRLITLDLPDAWREREGLKELMAWVESRPG